MKTQMHALKNGQEHAKPTGGDIISTVKPCWPIRSLNKFLVGGNNSAGSDVTNQKLSCLHDNTAAGVFLNLKKYWFQWPGAAIACGRTAKPHRKSCGFENNRVRVDRAWELPYCRLQFQHYFNTPSQLSYRVTLNTLISWWDRCVWFGLELKSAGR